MEERLLLSGGNHAPILNPKAEMRLATIVEDDVKNSGTSVADIIASAGAGAITDSDLFAFRGLAITAAPTTNGTWQFTIDDAKNWTTFAASSTFSLLLASSSTNRIRFVPNANVNGTNIGSLTVRAWDRSSGTSGTVANTTVNGGSTAFSTNSVTADITVTPVNDAPVMDNVASTTFTPIYEDFTNNGGTSVSSLLGNHVTDADTSALKGIAVVGTDITHGNWQFSTDNQTTWTTFRGYYTGARLLSEDAYIRFVPKPDYNGTVSPAITFRAWDMTSGAEGGTASTTTNGGSSAFSTLTNTASILVTPVNDAPVLNDMAALKFFDVKEDDTTNSGTLISDLIASAGGDRIIDVDVGAVEGIAVTALNNSFGRWQFTINSGQIWVDLNAASNSEARLLAANAGTRLRLVPNPNYNGTISAAIAFRAWDQTGGANGSTADTTNNGGITPFSSAQLMPSLRVNPINDAPVLDNTGTMTLTAVQTGAANPGTKITDLIASAGGNRITDVDSGAVEGIAIVATDTSHGTWQFTTNGTTWTTFRGYFGSARLLAADANTRIRFVPAAGYTGTVSPAITFRAWDQSEGVNGGTANALSTQMTTAFSQATETASISVLA